LRYAETADRLRQGYGESAEASAEAEMGTVPFMAVSARAAFTDADAIEAVRQALEEILA
jgi:hypothetical protein